MSKITIEKRKMGNSFSKSLFILLGIYAIIKIYLGVNLYGIIVFSIFILLAILFIFGKIMIAIDTEKKIINIYFQLLTLKIGNSQILPPIKHILVRDFNSINQTFVSSFSCCYYEISLYSLCHKRIIIGLYQNKDKVNKILQQLSKSTNWEIRDTTKQKIVKL
jgi:hypothetical protein